MVKKPEALTNRSTLTGADMEEKENPNGYEDRHFENDIEYREFSLDEFRAQYGELPDYLQKRIDEVAKQRPSKKL